MQGIRMIDILTHNHRISAVHQAQVLNSQYETFYKSICELATYICDVPVAMISFIGEESLWVTSERVGYSLTRMPPRVEFCEWAVTNVKYLEVKDTLLCPKNSYKPLVNNFPQFRFYAAAPLRLTLGEAVGVISVFHTKPHELNQLQKNALVGLTEVATKVGGNLPRLPQVKVLDDDIISDTCEAQTLDSHDKMLGEHTITVFHKDQVLDSQYETFYRAICKLAAEVSDVPIAMISFVEDESIWISTEISTVKLAGKQTFSAWVADHDEYIEIKDTLMAGNHDYQPLRSNFPHFRFYAGTPLKLPLGEVIGTICVFHTKPHELTASQKNILAGLADVVTKALVIKHNIEANLSHDSNRNLSSRRIA